MSNICSVEGCLKSVKYKGLCSTHYKRNWRHGDPTKTLIAPKGTHVGARCLSVLCNEFAARGSAYCTTHRSRIQRKGYDYLDRRPNGDGAINSAGYHLITVDGKRQYAHRVEAEKKIGRKLLPEEVVHHIDGDPQNNSWDNLEVLPSQSAHMKLHGETK